MKKIVSYATCLLLMSSAFASPGSALIQKFNQTFPNAQNVKWNDDKAGYFVSFYQNGNFEKVLYNKEGDFNCSWKYSDGKTLPTNIVMMLNKKYNDGKIIGVTEVTTQDNINYSVQLTKGANLYSVNISADGSITKAVKYNNPNSAQNAE